MAEVARASALPERGHSRPTPERLSAWERRQYSALRRHTELVTVVDDELPELGYWLATHP